MEGGRGGEQGSSETKALRSYAQVNNSKSQVNYNELLIISREAHLSVGNAAGGVAKNRLHGEFGS